MLGRVTPVARLRRIRRGSRHWSLRLRSGQGGAPQRIASCNEVPVKKREKNEKSPADETMGAIIRLRPSSDDYGRLCNGPL
jgi:hypothetical protein